MTLGAHISHLITCPAIRPARDRCVLCLALAAVNCLFTYPGREWLQFKGSDLCYPERGRSSFKHFHIPRWNSAGDAPSSCPVERGQQVFLLSGHRGYPHQAASAKFTIGTRDLQRTIWGGKKWAKEMGEMNSSEPASVGWLDPYLGQQLQTVAASNH